MADRIVYDNIIIPQSTTTTTTASRNSVSSGSALSTTLSSAGTDVVSFRAASTSDREFAGALLDASSIEPIAKLGSGAYGDVWRATMRGERVAVKMPRLKQQLSDEQRRILTKEVYVLSEKRHPNLLLLMGCCIDEHRFWIVTELLECDLRVYLQRRSFTLHERLKMLEVSFDSLIVITIDCLFCFVLYVCMYTLLI